MREMTFRWFGLALFTIAMAAFGCTRATAQTGDRPSAPIQPLNTAPAFDYFGGFTLSDDIPSPVDVLGYEIGEQFTRHADVVDYLETIAAASDRVEMQQYGRSHENRTLHYLVISSPANLDRLDEIRERNLELADPDTSDARARTIIQSNPAIVWFSYNVHGNEASSSEAAMQLVYTMAAAQDASVQDLLDNVVLVVDPMLNPDGRDRYVNWYNMVYGPGVGPNSSHDAVEHDEPWPGGRTNHYYFDLNRDWLWLVHPESESRVAVYREFKPQLHIDYHEQGYRSPYFFGAGDDPYNQNIPAETREWLDIYGAGNAAAFDARGLVYATRERFDYLYPGYGKVLPVYHGAIGLLCEQAGHGFAGLAVDVMGEYELTLRRRAFNHFLTGMSYLETTAANREAQLERFRRFFTESASIADDGPMAFLIRADNDPALLVKVWDLCAAHGIEIETLDENADIPGLTSYKTGGDPGPGKMPAGTWIIRADQSMGRLARAVFERETEVTDHDTYDITAWSLPVSFGLHAYYTHDAVQAPTTTLEAYGFGDGEMTGAGEVAFMVDATQHRFPVAVSHAIANELFARMTGDLVTTTDGESFGAGSLIVHTVRNQPESLQAFVDACLADGLNVHRVGSGLTSEGFVLGANDNGLFELPRVLLVRDRPTNSYSFGQHWHLLDQESPIPHTVVNADSLSRIDLDLYNVIVLPEIFGSLDERTTEAINEWVRGGGTLIATGGSAMWASRSILDIDRDDDDDSDDDRPAPSELTYQEREDRRVDDRVPGALLLANIDVTHPLAAGAGEWIGVLKRSSRVIPVDDDGYVVARFADASAGESLRIGGTISKRNEDRIGGTPFMTQHNHGRGAVICFSDDQTFRGFHHAGMRLLMNAIIFGPSL